MCCGTSAHVRHRHPKTNRARCPEFYCQNGKNHTHTQAQTHTHTHARPHSTTRAAQQQRHPPMQPTCKWVCVVCKLNVRAQDKWVQIYAARCVGQQHVATAVGASVCVCVLALAVSFPQRDYLYLCAPTRTDRLINPFVKRMV